MRGAGHSRELLVEPEEVLVGHRGEGLVLAPGLDPLLGLDGLVEPVAPAAPGHEAAGELVHDDDLGLPLLPRLDDVLGVLLVEVVGLQGLLEVVGPLHLAGRVERLHADHPLRLLDALLGEDRLVVLLVHLEVGPLLEAADHAVGDAVLLRALLRGSRDDERGARLVDEDVVHLVHDGVVEVGEALLLLAGTHVVAQVVEAELRVRPVGHVHAVGGELVGDGHVGVDGADLHPESREDRPDPVPVAPREVVVGGDDVHALAVEGVEVGGGDGDEGLALARGRLRDAAPVEDDPAQHLHVEGAHPDRAACGLADGGEGLGEERVEFLPAGPAGAEGGGLPAQRRVGEALELRPELVDAPDEGGQLLDAPLVVGAEDELEALREPGPVQGATPPRRLPRRGSRAPSRPDPTRLADPAGCRDEWRAGRPSRERSRSRPPSRGASPSRGRPRRPVGARRGGPRRRGARPSGRA